MDNAATDNNRRIFIIADDQAPELKRLAVSLSKTCNVISVSPGATLSEVDASDVEKPIAITTEPLIPSDKTFNIFWMVNSDHQINERLSESLRDFNLVVVDSTLKSNELLELGINNAVIGVGVDEDVFRFPVKTLTLDNATKASLPTNNFAVYVGPINESIDLNYLSALKDSKIDLVIAGSIDSAFDSQRFNEICHSPNITHLGPVANEVAAELMNTASVGVVPFKTTSDDTDSVAIKLTVEYLMCGMPVVASSLETLDEFSFDDVRTASSQEQFVHYVSEVLFDPAQPSQRVMRSSRIAQEWSWDKKAQQFLGLAI